MNQLIFTPRECKILHSRGVKRFWHLRTWYLLCFLLVGCATPQYLTTPDGARLAYEESRANPQKGTVLLVHGLGSTREEWTFFQDFLKKNGWSSVAFDLRGHGWSTEWQGKEMNWQGLTTKGIPSLTRDIQTVVENFPASGPIWLMGSSLGADLALLYAARDPKIHGVVLLSPPTAYFRKQGGFREVLESYGKRPFFIAASAEDGHLLQNAEALHKHALGPKKIVNYAEAGHGSEMFNHEEGLEKEILHWLNQETN